MATTEQALRREQPGTPAQEDAAKLHATAAPAGTNRPLTTFEVLAEEYQHLHGGPKPESAPPAVFEGQHIRDLGALARRLVDPTRGHSLLGAELPEAVRLRLKEYEAANFPSSGPLADTLRGELAAFINARLDTHSPGTDAFIATIPEDSPRRSEFLACDARDVRRRNWLVLEESFPEQIVRLRDVSLQALYARVRQQGHAALCLSGGGIRSATFALGVVQALARADVLGRFHYLSTVSGGGYLGSWLSAWSRRVGFAQVIEKLKAAPQSALEPEQAPVRHLRSYSNFLSPRVGALSADTWTLAATYLRNLLLNWLVLIPILAAAVGVPYFAASFLGRNPAVWLTSVSEAGPWLVRAEFVACLLGILVSGGIALRFAYKGRPASTPGPGASSLGALQQKLSTNFLAPLMVCLGLLIAVWSWRAESGMPDGRGLLIATILSAGLALSNGHWRSRERTWGERLLAGGVWAFIGGLSYAGLVWLHGWCASAGTGWKLDSLHLFTTLALPLVLGMLTLGVTLCVGLLGDAYTDADREWAARFNALLMMVLASWSVVSGLVLLGPVLVAKAGSNVWAACGSAGGLSGLVTVLFASGSNANGPPGPAQGARSDSLMARLQRGAVALAAPLFIASLVLLLSMMDSALIRRAHQLYMTHAVPWLRQRPFGDLFGNHPHPPVILVGFVLGALGGLGFWMGRLINTNRFSLHGMYRERLIRAYLGASRPAGERHPDPFTGFDSKDNLQMHELVPESPAPALQAPLHVVNMALNLVGGTSLAWQQRKASSFTVSPLHAGASTLGYRRSRAYGGPKGISLGTAVTISGAAANPSMGYNSSPVVTFLMTLFNARLGAWLGNPGPAGQQTYTYASPRSSTKSLLGELLGRTNDTNAYVNLSDGGHFENLALYEMVLRRCRFIVVSDASCDPEFKFEDLANAVRKIRIDLGVPIEFEASFGIGPRALGTAGRHCAFARIRYSAVDLDASAREAGADACDGILVYVKPSLYEHQEPRDVLHYAKTSETFPHETTADQFFSESQFESYRSLGLYIGQRVCESLQRPAPWVADILKTMPSLELP